MAVVAASAPDAKFGVKFLALSGILVLGTITTLDTKLIFSTKSEDSMGHVKPFAKPWFAVFAMFCGMAMSLPMWLVLNILIPRMHQARAAAAKAGKGGDNKVSEAKTDAISTVVAGANEEPLLAGSNCNTDAEIVQQDLSEEAQLRQTVSKLGVWGVLWRCSFPACCDLCATGLQSWGLMFIAPSVFSIFRGCNILFVAIFSVLFLKRKLTTNSVTGLVLVFVALGIVGLAASKADIIDQLFGTATGNSFDQDMTPTAAAIEHHKTASELSLETEAASVVDAENAVALFGMFLVSIAQVLQATQYIWEEKMMKDMKLPPLMLLGIEGVFGALAMLCVAYPVLYVLPGSDPCANRDDGTLYTCRESLYDNFTMLANSPDLRLCVFVYWFAIFGLNVCGVNCTKLLSGMVRALMQNGIRTLTVWMTDLFLFYAVTKGGFGEAWTEPFSSVQMFGFGVYVFGTLMYMGFIDVVGLLAGTAADKNKAKGVA